DSEHSWNVAFGDKPLFTAIREGVPQPVTGSIEISRGPFGGVNLYFGTGRYFAEGDNETSEVQSFYGIWDSPGQGPVAGRGALIQQLISAGTMSNGYTTRNISRNPVSYATSRGWYVDLVVGTEAAGERFIGAPRLQSGKVIFATYQPGAAICSAGGGQNWEYALDILTGGGAMSGVTVTPDGASVCVGDCGAITLNPDGTGAPVRSIDIFVPQPFRPGTGATPPGACDPADPACVDDMINASKCTFVLRAAGAGPQHLPRPCGRQSWRQVR
ncbi:MAG: pilus assembly protein PilC, partial [Gammaproteobacteria bacterium]|nr:pilus assembly protein PilC [Gammaproteobacteria bacterium]